MRSLFLLRSEVQQAIQGVLSEFTKAARRYAWSLVETVAAEEPGVDGKSRGQKWGWVVRLKVHF